MPLTPKEIQKQIKRLDSNFKRFKLNSSVEHYGEMMRYHLRKIESHLDELEDNARFIPNLAGKWFPKKELRKAEP